MYFESKGEFEKAVQLFHKGGDLPRAMDLCFRAGETMQKKLPQGIPPPLPSPPHPWHNTPIHTHTHPPLITHPLNTLHYQPPSELPQGTPLRYPPTPGITHPIITSPINIPYLNTPYRYTLS